jgi:RNA polymerase sigma-70 factor (ECF subfamily)
MTKPSQRTEVGVPVSESRDGVVAAPDSQHPVFATFVAHAVDDLMLPCSPEMRSSTARDGVSCVDVTLNVAQHDYRTRPIESEFEKVIKFKAIRLARLWPFRRDDVRDLRQDLRLAWLAKRDAFDPSRSSIRSFFKTILERTASKLRRTAVAEARRYGPQASWDALMEGPLADHIQASGDRRQLDIGHDPLTHVDAIQIQQDVPDVLTLLSPKESDLWKQIAERSVAEIHREKGIPETTLYSRVTRLRKRFETPRFRDLL